MATLHKRYGWKWTEVERLARQGALAKARRTAETIARQLPLIGQHARVCLVRAESISDALQKAVLVLSGIELRRSAHRKYQPLSPTEFDAALAEFSEAVEQWNKMTSATEYQALVRAANRVTRRENARIREHNHQVIAALERDRREVEEALLSGNVGNIMREIARTIKERDN